MNQTLTRPRRRGRVRGALLAVVLGLGGVAALPAAPGAAAQDVVVSPAAKGNQPKVRNGRVYDIDSHGSVVAVAGSFTQVRDDGSTSDVARQWLFLFDRGTGKVIGGFDARLGGPAPDPGNGVVKPQPGVEAVEFSADGKALYIAGSFTTVNGRSAPHVARLRVGDGSLDTRFTGDTDRPVRAMELVSDHMLVIGGDFTEVNGEPAQRLAALNPVTGGTRAEFDLPATQSRDQYAPYVLEMAASPNGRWLAVAGSFERVGGQPRNQIALIDLSGRPRLAPWSTDAYAADCSSVTLDSYIRGIAFSPRSDFMVVNTTGAYIGLDTMCDTAARWEIPGGVPGDQTWTWRLKTGGDTLYAAHVTDAAVYLGGHQRWLNNPRPSPNGDNDGPGSVSRPGVAAVDPLTGVPLSWNPGRDRGRGAEAIHADDQNLYVGSDTDLWGTETLPAGDPRLSRPRLAVLPVAGGTRNPQPVDVRLPVDLYLTAGSGLHRVTFDGTRFEALQPVSTDGQSWAGVRDGFVQNGDLHYFGPDQNFWSRPFTGSGIGQPTNLSETVGYLDSNHDLTPDDQPYGIAETTVATYHRGRIYYVKAGDPKLYWRGYSLQSGIVDANEQVVPATASFAGATALDFVSGSLYAAWIDGSLYRFSTAGGVVGAGSRSLVDNGSVIDWSQVGGMWSVPTGGPGPGPGEDVRAATTTVSGPRPNQQVGRAVTVRGSASDDRAVREVRVAVRSRTSSTRPWLQANGSWGRRPAYRTATLTAAQAPATAWSLGLRLPDGLYALDVKAVDTAGKVGPAVHRPFVVNAPDGDRTAPGATVTAPRAGSVRRSPLRLQGTARDNRAVRHVLVSVARQGAPVARRWLTARGGWGAQQEFRPATLARARSRSTTWRLALRLPPGRYAVQVLTVDASFNLDRSPAVKRVRVGGRR